MPALVTNQVPAPESAGPSAPFTSTDARVASMCVQHVAFFCRSPRSLPWRTVLQCAPAPPQAQVALEQPDAGLRQSPSGHTYNVLLVLALVL